MSGKTNRRFSVMACTMLALGCPAQTGHAQTSGPLAPTDGGVIDLPMLRDPVLLERETVVDFDPGFKQLWVAAMGRPEYDLRMDAILAFIDVHERGATGLDDLPPLFADRLLNDPHRFVRLAAARAIVAFDYRDAAAELLEASQAPINVGLDMIAVADPALSDWDYAPARPVWIKYLDSLDTAPARAASAMRCLGLVRAEEAIDALLVVVENRSLPDTLRLTAAEALGSMTDSRVRASALVLASSDDVLDRLFAVRMLKSDTTMDAQVLLEGLATCRTVVAAPALGALNRIDPDIVATKFTNLISDDDPNVRIEVVRALAHTATPVAVASLIASLGDEDPDARYFVRDALIRFGESDLLSGEVRQACAAVLAGSDWRSLEQAALIAGALRMEQSAGRLAELLAHDRPETRLAAASALCRLNLESTLPAILDRVRVLTDLALEAGSRPAEYKAIGAETTQLVIALGEMRYEPAAQLLVRYIPKHSGFDGMARGAALYALGRIYEDKLRPDLSALFQERLADDTPIDPESAYVRRFAAIGLGRMKAADGLDTLRDFYSADVQITSIAGACRWAIMQIEPGDLPQLKPLVDRPGGYFLEPAEDRGALIGY